MALWANGFSLGLRAQATCPEMRLTLKPMALALRRGGPLAKKRRLREGTALATADDHVMSTSAC